MYEHERPHNKMRPISPNYWKTDAKRRRERKAKREEDSVEGVPLVQRNDGKLTPEEMLELPMLRRMGLRNNEIGNIKGVSGEVIGSAFRKLQERGIPVPKPYARRKVEKKTTQNPL